MDKQGPYSVLSALEGVKGKEKPPIHLWNPENVKEIDMEIKATGEWFYLGTPIKRSRLVHLFASVLRREADGQYYLVTPVEKCRIRVVDVPFQIVSMNRTGEGRTQQLELLTNMAESVIVDSAHPLRFEHRGDETIPYVEVRDKLEARVGRNVYYEMAEHLQTHLLDGKTWLGLWSAGQFFPAIIDGAG